MIAEVVKTFNLLTRPLHRQFWLPSRSGAATDQPGVVLISVDDLTEREEIRLQRLLSNYRIQPLLDSKLPPNHIDEHLDPESFWESLYRAGMLTGFTVSRARLLMSGRVSLAVHICEIDDLARLHFRLMEGKPITHIGTLATDRATRIRRLGKFLRGLETRPYELWLIARNQKRAYLPAVLPLPEEPLTVDEVYQMATRRPYLDPDTHAVEKLPKLPGTLRIMTYNVHSGIGLDGRLSLRRIAEVLHKYDPDFVALQELDLGCRRTRGKDQLDELKNLWPSEGEFFPLVRMKGGRYGIGYLSRLPIKSCNSQLLPSVAQMLPQEARGIQKITVELPDQSQLDIWNTHLGLTLKERRAQIKALLKLTFESRAQILTGDFNCRPRSKEYRMISRAWQPTQHNPAKTWFGTFPVRHLDYCFFRGEIRVVQSYVPKNSLTRLASDHLPLITDFQLPGG
ncbi:MAG: endonuclease/exonuclease/phosphatase family protein [Vulcanimicrobiota bacterium]